MYKRSTYLCPHFLHVTCMLLLQTTLLTMFWTFSYRFWTKQRTYIKPLLHAYKPSSKTQHLYTCLYSPWKGLSLPLSSELSWAGICCSRDAFLACVKVMNQGSFRLLQGTLHGTTGNRRLQTKVCSISLGAICSILFSKTLFPYKRWRCAGPASWLGQSENARLMKIAAVAQILNVPWSSTLSLPEFVSMSWAAVQVLDVKCLESALWSTLEAWDSLNKASFITRHICSTRGSSEPFSSASGQMSLAFWSTEDPCCSRSHSMTAAFYFPLSRSGSIYIAV